MTSSQTVHPSRSDLRGPASVVAATAAAMLLAPFVEPTLSIWGAVHALVVGGVMASAVGLTLHLFQQDKGVAATVRQGSAVAAVLRDRTLHAVAQPIVDLTNDRVTGVEMLTRFDVEPASPQHWFSAAADAGRQADLELLAVDEALRAARDLPDRLTVSINVSPTTLCTRELRTAIARAAIEPRRIILELTEHDQIDDYDALRTALRPLRAMGVRLAVDDAGAGYSSFRHILNLRPDAIKVDRALVSGIHADAGKRALAAAIVLFALEMHATVTAEGVERDEELQALKLLGMDNAQGYLLGRPTPDRSVWAAWAHAPATLP